MLSSFTKDTRHRIREDTDTSAIALKFLCTQLPHWSLVYPHIADDLESVQFRAPGVLDNYAKYKQIEPKDLAEMTKNSGEKNSLLVDHFIETVGFPIDFSNDQKLHAFFLLGQKHKNLDEHLNFLLPDEFEEKKRLFQAIQDFELPSSPDVIEQIAGILTSMPKKDDIIEQEVVGTESQKKIQKQDEYLIDRKIQLPDTTGKTLSDQDLWDNPIISQFKEVAGLARHFPSFKIVSQILSKLINAEETIGSQMMGKFQTEIPSLDGIQRNSDAFRDLLKIIPGEKMQAAIETEEMENFYHGLKEDKKPKDKLECVQMYVSLLESENVIKKLI